ncbi:hypothetical protein D3C87_1787000 [compost metagenome]
MPEGPLPVFVNLGGMRGDGAHPEMVILELANEVVAVEVDRGVDDRALAVMGLEAVEETLHLGTDDARSRARLAGGGGGVPFHIENRR